MAKILIACEESQRVTIEMRKMGHECYSCDIRECSGGHPEWHIKSDVIPLLNGHCVFNTCDGFMHEIPGKWDMIIAHPPCTRLCASGQRWLHYGSEEYRSKKIAEQKKAIEFFMQFVYADCDKIAIENPVGIMSTKYRKPDFTYNPYDFEGECECKRTCMWTKGLPPLKPTQKISKRDRKHYLINAEFEGKQYSYSDPIVAVLRSKTPLGVAKAIASQWGELLEKERTI